ncbi:unnamed protein product [Zymoseptoria tritici ST99CH_3D7]|uniref:Kelch repeat-containing protein n=1 Tax=Zymoseptoria tritici (strain ST99CH_3D7) TaxID=1276538 RepID=A0A1X7RCA6_ZYMT9|nr:unnamed protein product [Zymoseptoria tritici ST99CH_3D7]
MNWYGIAVLCLAWANVTRAQKDPLVDFCRRWSHQTTVVDNKLFIYGGFVTYGSQIEEDTQNSTNFHLLYSDLGSVDQNTGMPIQYDLSKPSEVPVVSGGALWSDDVNKIFYLFGGQNDQQAQSPRQNTIWSYDILNDAWREMPTNSRSTDITIPAFGASTTDPNQGIGYYYGGWTDNSGGNAYSTAATAKSKMIVYEYESNIWHEIRFIDDVPRAEGALFYIASDHGMLIYLGGVEQNVSGTYDGVAMDKIHVFDIGSGASYTQQTSGTSPAKRRRFCGGVSWPDDRSSYNIYLYGGLPPQEDGGLGYNDVWTLSIPSFTWTSNFTSPVKSHHSSTCDIAQAGQMIIIGGYFPNSSDVDCDNRNGYGQHNLNLGSENDENAAWYNYLPDITGYSVPPYMTDVIGGDASGSATVTQPADGFVGANGDLAVLLPRHAPTSTRTATISDRATASPTQTSRPPGDNPTTNTGAIAGGVVGGVAFLVLLLVFGFCCHGFPATKDGNPYSAASYPSPVPSYHQAPSASPPLAGNWTPAQAFFSPPPPQGQEYYPPPPPPQLRNPSPGPVHEMPNVRSPTNVVDLQGPSPWKWRSPGGGIREE